MSFRDRARCFLQRTALVATVVASIFAITISSAQAAPTAVTPIPAGALSGDMRVVGFDAGIAKANGFEVLTTPQGKQYSVRSGTAGIATPNNQVGGNCGFSYVYEYGIGNRAVELYTGYSVTGSVTQWYWTVRLDDRGGSSFQRFQGGANGGIWQVDRVIGGLTVGGARATVIGPSSVAFLTDGRVCYSGSPYADTTIT